MKITLADYENEGQSLDLNNEEYENKELIYMTTNKGSFTFHLNDMIVALSAFDQFVKLSHERDKRLDS